MDGKKLRGLTARGVFTVAARGVFMVVAGGALVTNTFAQQYPNRQIHMLVGQPPGGPTDLAARVYGEKMRAELGQPFLVENRPGAAAQISILATARDPADGYNLNYVGPGITTLPVLSKTYTIDSIKDLTLISQIVDLKVAVMVSSTVPVKTLDEFVADLRANPGKRFYGNMGATDMLTMSLFLAALNVPYETIRYNGAAPAFQALFRDEVQFTYTTVGVAKPYADAGRLRIIAVTGTKRSPLLPDVPSVGESSNPRVKALATSNMAGSFFGLIGPANMPAAIVDTLYRTTAKVAKDPDFGKKMIDMGFDPVGNSPAEFTERVKRELEGVRAAAKTLNIQPE